MRAAKGKFTAAQKKELFQLVARNNTVRTDVISKLGILERQEAAWKDPDYNYVWEGEKHILREGRERDRGERMRETDTDTWRERGGGGEGESESEREREREENAILYFAILRSVWCGEEGGGSELRSLRAGEVKRGRGREVGLAPATSLALSVQHLNCHTLCSLACLPVSSDLAWIG